jgi:hypothetical protein
MEREKYITELEMKNDVAKSVRRAFSDIADDEMSSPGHKVIRSSAKLGPKD